MAASMVFCRLLPRERQRSRAWMARGPAMRRGVCESPGRRCYVRSTPRATARRRSSPAAHVAGVGRQHDEAVRLRHRRQDARALVAGRAHGAAAVAVGRQDAALELGAARHLADRRRQRHLERRQRRDVALALQDRAARRARTGRTSPSPTPDCRAGRRNARRRSGRRRADGPASSRSSRTAPRRACRAAASRSRPRRPTRRPT